MCLLLLGLASMKFACFLREEAHRDGLLYIIEESQLSRARKSVNVAALAVPALELKAAARPKPGAMD